MTCAAASAQTKRGNNAHYQRLLREVGSHLVIQEKPPAQTKLPPHLSVIELPVPIEGPPERGKRCPASESGTNSALLECPIPNRLCSRNVRIRIASF